jgi:hypothetical protein
MTTKIGTSQYSASLAYYIDANNFVMCYVTSDTLTLTKRISGSYTTVASTSLSVVADDKLELCLTRNGNAFELIAIKNNNRDVLYSVSGSITIGTTGYLGVGSAISPTKYDNIENLSITATAHAHHSDIAEVAKEVTTHYNEGGFAESTTITRGTTYSKSIPLGRDDYKFAIVMFAVDYTGTESPGCTVHTGRTAASAISNYGFADGSVFSYASYDRAVDSALTYAYESNGASGAKNIGLNDCYINGSNLYFEWENVHVSAEATLDITVQWRVFR